MFQGTMKYTKAPALKGLVNIDFKLKWFLYNGYLEGNQAEMVVNWFLVPVKNNCSCRLNYVLN